MQINSALNLVFPITYATREEDGKAIAVPVLWAYHAPLSMDVFEANHRVFADANNEIFGPGAEYTFESATRIAKFSLLDAAARDAKRFRLEESVGPKILAEIKRLTYILAPGKEGFEQTPIDIAINHKIIDAEDWAEAESSIVFFTCVYLMSKRIIREKVAESVASQLRGSMTSLLPMEYVASLRTLTPDAASAKTDPSSPPSSIG